MILIRVKYILNVGAWDWIWIQNKYDETLYDDLCGFNPTEGIWRKITHFFWYHVYLNLNHSSL